jgi:hypothetical protein
MSKKKSSNKDRKLNKKLGISFLIFVISGIIALIIILNKGVIFGNRLVAITDGSAVESAHTFQMVAESNYLTTSENNTTKLMLTLDGVDITENFEITSSNEDIIKIEHNEEENTYSAVAVSSGTAVITAKDSSYGLESTVTIEVVVPITKLILSAEFTTIAVGEQSSIEYSYKPTNATAHITYESSDESIATVNTSGIVTGVSAGIVTITGTDELTGVSGTYKIIVK